MLFSKVKNLLFECYRAPARLLSLKAVKGDNFVQKPYRVMSLGQIVAALVIMSIDSPIVNTHAKPLTVLYMYNYRAPDKVRFFISKMPISSPNPMSMSLRLF